ncbi:hypothetical protein STAS_31300 [Striga asiatica]|uniref:Uncharacterized protein n=1 Tax=Striga asiatica TaxID=4170 RepID=A0A5A7RAY2_STRAF|nr:hypothetical protein STAS_31300 [Striga asiatica]
MEKLLNHNDKEYLKMAMLKHEETFRDQLYELHRLYRIQKVLMNEAKNSLENNPTKNESPANDDAYNIPGSIDKLRVSQAEVDHGDLELTLGPKIYYQEKIKDRLNNPPWLFQALSMNVT